MKRGRSVVALGATTLAACAAALPAGAVGATLPDREAPARRAIEPAVRAAIGTVANAAIEPAVRAAIGTVANAAIEPTARAAISGQTTASAQTASAQIRWVCHGPADVFDTPGGIVIGILARGDQVRVLLHSARRPRWVMVSGPIEIHGWMNEGALC